MDRCTCPTGQSLLASITRTREPSAESISAWEQNSSPISDTRRSVVGSQFKAKAISPGQIRHKEPSSSSTILLLSCFLMSITFPQCELGGQPGAEAGLLVSG